jgi:hypothetical protein
MIPNPKSNILSHQANAFLYNGSPLINFSINGVLEIDAGSEWKNEVFIENCIVDNLKCLMVYFQKKVTIKNSYLRDASFNFSFFLGGLIIENCIFDNYLDFEAGGHNDSGSIIIRDNQFKGFVNFFDCWFTGEVYVKNNVFEKGTNISSNDQLVSFDIPIQLALNTGDLLIESECRN